MAKTETGYLDVIDMLRKLGPEMSDKELTKIIDAIEDQRYRNSVRNQAGSVQPKPSSSATGANGTQAKKVNPSQKSGR